MVVPRLHAARLFSAGKSCVLPLPSVILSWLLFARYVVLITCQQASVAP